MATTINIENAKQIRQPMDVVFEMPLYTDYVTLSYSGYTATAKVADGVLGERNWDMRTLADLQGDGFQLNGAAELYDPATTASQGNGKIGVRGNIGQSVAVTVAGSSEITSLLVAVTGAASVNGIAITGATANVPVLASTITLTFTAAATAERVEVNYIEPMSIFRIDNSRLIKATVSLRSDLSLFDQTLPESEINIEAYHPIDVAEYVANIPADTPITYQAGYPGDMSPVRKFYITGQVTWADNVLKIQAVDAVHFLDNYSFKAPVTVTDTDYFLNAAKYVLKKAGIDYAEDWDWIPWGKSRVIIPKGIGFREFLAILNQMFNLTDESAAMIDGSGKIDNPLKFMYRDAGQPILSTISTFAVRTWTIHESDCSNIEKNTEKRISRVKTEWTRIINPTMLIDGDYSTYSSNAKKVGSATLIKNVGISLNFDAYAYDWVIGFFLGENGNNDTMQRLLSYYGSVGYSYNVASVVPNNKKGETGAQTAYYHLPEIYDPYVGEMLAHGSIAQEDFQYYPTPNAEVDFSSFVPWSQKLDGWNMIGNTELYTIASYYNRFINASVVNAQSSEIDLDIYGLAFDTESKDVEYKRNDSDGDSVEINAPFIGEIMASREGKYIQVYPSKCLSVPLYRSRNTGSFTWKGDPRMQPRDVVRFEKRDGTVIDITLENITLTHEKGGTIAEIIYREGII